MTVEIPLIELVEALDDLSPKILALASRYCFSRSARVLAASILEAEEAEEVELAEEGRLRICILGWVRAGAMEVDPVEDVTW